MEYMESIQLHTYKQKTVFIHFKIETSRYDNFSKPFKTDKYINVVHWEYIMYKLNRGLSEITRKNANWHTLNNKFIVDDLYVVNYEFKDKSNGIINFNDISYEFDWIMYVTINKSSTIQDSYSISSHSNSSNSKKRDSSSSKGSSTHNDENFKILLDSEEFVHESKKAKIVEEYEPLVLQQSDQNRVRTRKGKQDGGKQTSITNFISNKKDKCKREKSKDVKPSTSKDALVQLNKEKLQQMNDFVARSEEEEKKNLERKELLKDLPILNCFHVKDDEVVEIIKDFEPTLNELFSNDADKLGSAKLNACDITSSNIVTEKQSMFILQTITKQHTKDGIEPCEDILINVALPRVIIELFKNHYKLRTEEALERIMQQEEKKILFMKDFNESY